jgi:hypothetical protein
MKKLITYFQRWNKWRKRNLNGKLHHILVLLGLANSPTFDMTYTDAEEAELHAAYMKAMNEGLEVAKRQ